MIQRRLLVLLPMVAAASGSLTVPAASVAAPAQVTVQRIFGADRYGTSAAIAQNTFGTSTTAIGKAVIANGNDFPDAVVGANFLSGYFGPGPVLLTRPHEGPRPILSVLMSLAIPQPQIIGGTTAVDLTVERRLQTVVAAFGTSGEVTRYSGSDRYATGARVARSAFDPESNQIGVLDGKGTAFLVSGVSASDALASAPLTYALHGSPVLRKFPLLLTDPAGLSIPTRDSLRSLSSGDGRRIEQVIVIGGPGAVSPAVLTQIRALGISTRRIQGVDRQATAVAVANFAIETLGWDPTHINLARGDDFADAASAAPHAGQDRAPLLFTESPDRLGNATADYLRVHASTITSIDVLGGPGAVSDAVVAQAQNAAGG